jgi:hypothetical protein
MRRFLLFVFFSCTAASVAFSVWPRQLGGYLAMARARRDLAQPPALVYPPAPWGSRPAR